MRVHIWSPNGIAKSWLEPIVALVEYYGIKSHELSEIEQIVKERRNDFINEWNRHFTK